MSVITEAFVLWDPSVSQTQKIRVSFNGVQSRTILWNSPYPPDTTYTISLGVPVISDGMGTVTVVNDLATQGIYGATFIASAPFTGYIDVIGYQSNVWPFT